MTTGMAESSNSSNFLECNIICLPNQCEVPYSRGVSTLKDKTTNPGSKFLVPKRHVHFLSETIV